MSEDAQKQAILTPRDIGLEPRPDINLVVVTTEIPASPVEGARLAIGLAPAEAREVAQRLLRLADEVEAGQLRIPGSATAQRPN